MALTEEQVVDKIEVLEDGTIQVRKATRILKDGVLIAQTYHRHCIAPGDDYQSEDARVVKAAQAFHDVETVDAYRTKQAPALEREK
jgi:hypothetical protein